MKRHAVKQDVKPRRARYNISLGEDTRELADALAREDVRSFSSMIEWLVQHEWRRRQEDEARVRACDCEKAGSA